MNNDSLYTKVTNSKKDSIFLINNAVWLFSMSIPILFDILKNENPSLLRYLTNKYYNKYQSIGSTISEKIEKTTDHLFMIKTIEEYKLLNSSQRLDFYNHITSFSFNSIMKGETELYGIWTVLSKMPRYNFRPHSFINDIVSAAIYNKVNIDKKQVLRRLRDFNYNYNISKDLHQMFKYSMRYLND